MGVRSHATALRRQLPWVGQPFSALKEGAAIQVVNDNAPSADRIVCRGRAGEHVAPPRASVSDGRQPTERESRPPRPAARLQAWVGSGSASPPPVEPTNLASALSLLPVWPGAPCVCWPTRRCCHAGTPPVGAIGPNFRGTLGRCRTVLGNATPTESQCVGGSCSWWRCATYRLRRSCTALSGGRLTGPQDCEATPTLGGVEPPFGLDHCAAGAPASLLGCDARLLAGRGSTMRGNA
jgi:hypothetical protein